MNVYKMMLERCKKNLGMTLPEFFLEVTRLRHEKKEKNLM
jgi:hypothetical protein